MMLVFSGKSNLELRKMTNHNWMKEGQIIEMDDAITAITASKNGDFLLVNISMTKPRIELLSFDQTTNWGTTIQKFKGHQ